MQKAPPPAGPSVICFQQTLAFLTLLAALLAAALLATLAGLRILLLLLAGLLILSALLLATLLLLALLIGFLVLLIHFRPLCCWGRCMAKYCPEPG
jgi:hypothetical protein